MYFFWPGKKEKRRELSSSSRKERRSDTCRQETADIYPADLVEKKRKRGETLHSIFLAGGRREKEAVNTETNHQNIPDRGGGKGGGKRSLPRCSQGRIVTGRRGEEKPLVLDFPQEEKKKKGGKGGTVRLAGFSQGEARNAQ